MKSFTMKNKIRTHSIMLIISLATIVFLIPWHLSSKILLVNHPMLSILGLASITLLSIVLFLSLAEKSREKFVPIFISFIFIFSVLVIIFTVIFAMPIGNSIRMGKRVCSWNNNSQACSDYKLLMSHHHYDLLINKFNIYHATMGDEAIRKARLYNSIVPNNELLTQTWKNGFISDDDARKWHNYVVKKLSENPSLAKKLSSNKLSELLAIK